MSEKLYQELCRQIAMEYHSMMSYVVLWTQFEVLSLDGFAHFFKVQSEEEKEHAEKFIRHLLDLNKEPQIGVIEPPKISLKHPKEAFEKALKQEQEVTRKIHELYTIASEEKFYPTMEFLHWFIEEQVEEENLMQSILDKFAFLGEDKAGIYLLNQELGKRKEES